MNYNKTFRSPRTHRTAIVRMYDTGWSLHICHPRRPRVTYSHRYEYSPPQDYDATLLHLTRLAVDWVGCGVSPAVQWTHAGYPGRGVAKRLPARMERERLEVRT